MKLNKKFLISLVLIVAIIACNVPFSTYATMYQKSVQLLSKYIGMDDERVYEEKVKDEPMALIEEIKELEKELVSETEKIDIVPHAVALLEKSNEFTGQEILNLLVEDDSGIVLESTLIKMYKNKGEDETKIKALIKNDNLSKESKEYIIALMDMKEEELEQIIKDNEDSLVIVSMKKLVLESPEKAANISKDILQESEKRKSAQKLIAACVGISSDQWNKFDEHEKNNILSNVKILYNSTKNTLLKDQIIYMLSRTNDFDVFEAIINSESVDFELKVSAIERNIQMLMDISLAPSSVREIECLKQAMKLHPIIEIGENLEKLLNEGKIKSDKELNEIVRHIETNGMRGVFKYE